MSAHSPAPWYRPRVPMHHTEVYVTKTERNEDLELIAEVGPAMRDDEALANACLVEASPDLLFAAKEALHALTRTIDSYNGETDIAESHGLDDEVGWLREAIAKYEDGLKSGTEAWERMMAGRGVEEVVQEQPSHPMDNWRCKYCGHLITMPCQKPECVEAKKAERRDEQARREARQFRGKVYRNMKASTDAAATR